MEVFMHFTSHVLHPVSFLTVDYCFVNNISAGVWFGSKYFSLFTHSKHQIIQSSCDMKMVLITLRKRLRRALTGCGAPVPKWEILPHISVRKWQSKHIPSRRTLISQSRLCYPLT